VTSGSGGARKFPLIPVIFAVVAVALITFVVLTFEGGTTKTHEFPAYGTPVVTGDALPAFGDATDAAIGMLAPTVTGTDFDGNPVTITNDGRPKIVIMLAHWCPHCQNEVPVVQAWLDSGGLPAGVDIYSVATGTTASRENFPPSAWLDREGWTVPVIVDDEQSTVGAAFGLRYFPYFVFISADGTIASRTSGELPVDTLAQIAQSLAAGS
jgi:cytochrome c biogenesis protein CcmG/thiol:disulfide interchange protein DsbE